MRGTLLGIPREDCTGHRTRIDNTPLGLVWRIIHIRHATQHRLDADTSDVKRWTGPKLAQGMIEPSSSDDTGGDAMMEGENADERSVCQGKA